MYWFLETPLTFFLMIISLIITVGAQIYVSSSYSKYKKQANSQELTGSEVARTILDKHGLESVYVVKTTGMLSDHYDPKRKVVRLSEEVYEGKSIASIAVAAHEVGHAIQDKEGYLYMRIRAILVPIVNIGSNLGFLAIILGIIFSYSAIIWYGIVALILSLVFQIVTLPVEFNASARAKNELATMENFNNRDKNGAESMLFAAAMTYVASVLTTVIQLLRLLIIARDND